MKLDRARELSDFVIFIYCDSKLHEGRTVAITNFALLPDGGWSEVPASRASTTKTIGTGRNLVGNSTTGPGWALDPEVSNAEIRSNHDLSCRKCHQRQPFTVQATKLYRVLDGLRGSGVLQAPLSHVAASLVEQAAEPPEPGQG